MVNLMPESSPPTPQANMPQGSSKQSRINWKNVLIGSLIGVVLIGAGGLVYYFVNKPKPTKAPEVFTPIKPATPSAQPATPPPKKDETAGWKVYTNTNLGFQLKYPQEVTTDFVAYSSGSGGNNILGVKGSTQREGTEFTDGLAVFIKTFDFTDSLENVAIKDRDPIKNNEFGILVTGDPKPQVTFQIQGVKIGEAEGARQVVIVDNEAIDDSR